MFLALACILAQLWFDPVLPARDAAAPLEWQKQQPSLCYTPDPFSVKWTQTAATLVCSAHCESSWKPTVYSWDAIGPTTGIRFVSCLCCAEK